MIFSLKECTCVIVASGNGVAPAEVVAMLLYEVLPKSAYKYSSLVLQADAIFHSIPPPATQPSRVPLHDAVLHVAVAALGKQS